MIFKGSYVSGVAWPTGWGFGRPTEQTGAAEFGLGLSVESGPGRITRPAPAVFPVVKTRMG